MQERRQALPSGSGLLGVPTAGWVALELIVIGLGLSVLGSDLALRVVGVCLVAAGCLVVPWQGSSALARMANRVTFTSHKAPTPTVTGASPAPEKSWDASFAEDAYVTLPEAPWQSLFPDAVVADVHDARDRTCGVVTFNGLTSLCFAAAPGQTVEGMALGEMCDRLVAGGLAVHSVVWSIRPPVLASPAELIGALQQQAIEAGYAVQWPSEVIVRFTEHQVQVAADVRGGGLEGRAAALTGAAVSVVQALRACGWTARPLDAQAISRDLERTLGAATRDLSGWVESWSGVLVGGRRHHALTLSQWSTGMRLEDVLRSASGVAVEFVVEALRLDEGRPVRVLARIHSEDAKAVATASRQMASSRVGGARWRPLDGEQLAALRATTLVGEGHE